MSTVQKWGMGIIAIAFVTTLILPGRQTVPVLSGVSKLATGTISTAQGTSTGPVG
jgi:hypothetical protein